MAVRDGDIVQTGDVLAEGIGTQIISRTDGVVRMRGDSVYVVRRASLDGGFTMVSNSDYDVIACLAERVDGDDAVVVEAGWAAYRSGYARIGSMTGIPIVMGWVNHQRQWRGSTFNAVAGTRQQDIDELYTDLRWEMAVEIINRYDIDYIMYGTTERQEYSSVGEEKFLENLAVVCESGDSRIFSFGQDVVLNTP